MAWERAGEGGTFHPFTVGFWVGRKATPNKMKEAQDALLALARGDEVKEGRVIMFEACLVRFQGNGRSCLLGHR